MGMFDHLNLRVPLPDGYTPPDGVCQTKDFSCDMDTLTITQEGRLVESGRGWGCDKVTQAEFEAIEARIAESQKVMPSYQSVRTYQIVSEAEIASLQRDLEFHGDMDFVCDRSGADGLCEYRARFTDGVLQGIEKLG